MDTQPAHKPVTENHAEAHSSRNVFIVILVVMLLGGVGAGAWYLHMQRQTPPNESNTTKVTDSYDDTEIIKPALDGTRGRQMLIKAATGGVMRVVDSRGIEIFLEIPPNALKKDTAIQLVPYLDDSKKTTLDTGVALLPSDVAFMEPVTLTFNLRGTKLSTTAPSNLSNKTLRISGQSQLYKVEGEDDHLTPMLIARAVETRTVVPARILGSGTYLLSLNSGRVEALARLALSNNKTRSLTILESATALVASGKKLSATEQARVKASISLIINKKDPPAPELFAALALRAKMEKKIAYFLPTVEAVDITDGYIEYMCKKEGQSVEAYRSMASTAQLLGKDDLADKCLTAAKNIVAERARKILANKEATPTTLLKVLQEVYWYGLDEDSDLDENLTRRVQDIVKKDAETVLNDPNATQIDMAMALQRMQGVGVEGAIHDRMESRLKEDVAKNGDTGANQGVNDLPAVSEEEQPLEGFDMSIIGLAMLKMLYDIDTFDGNGMEELKQKLNQQAEAAKMMSLAMCDAIPALGGDPPPECSTAESDITRAQRELEREADKAGAEIDRVRAKDDEEEDFDSGMLLYLEPTETPETEQPDIVNEDQNDVGTEDSGLYENDETSSEPTQEDSYDGGYESTDE